MKRRIDDSFPPTMLGDISATLLSPKRFVPKNTDVATGNDVRKQRSKRSAATEFETEISFYFKHKKQDQELQLPE